MNTPNQNPDPDALLWEAVVLRDARYDGFLYYAVRSTGIYCQPSCPSRRPARQHVQFFAHPDDAEHAGFRPCQRCHPRESQSPAPDSSAVHAAVRYMAQQEGELPNLKALASHAGVPPQHLQRRFKAILGVTPQQYGAALRVARFRDEVRMGGSVTAAAYGAGFGSSSRLYEHANTYLGMTPGRFKNGGKGATIIYAARETALGWLLVAKTDLGLCSVQLGDTCDVLYEALESDFSQATLLRDPHTLGPWLDAFSDYLEGSAKLPEFPLDVQATAFQARVWQALKAIPRGKTVTYRQLAEAIGAPDATRAAASACARNPVALAIPCHRVVPKSGGFGGYRWDPKRKKRLLEIERLG